MRHACQLPDFDHVRTIVRGKSPVLTGFIQPATMPDLCGLNAGAEQFGDCPYCSQAAKILTRAEQKGAPRTSREAIEQARDEFDAMAAEVRGPAPKVKRKSKKALRLERAAGHGKNAVPQWLKEADAEADAELRELTAGEIAS